MTEEKIILAESDEAAKFVTGISGWVDIHGNFISGWVDIHGNFHGTFVTGISGW